jgi:hypothetical protein
MLLALYKGIWPGRYRGKGDGKMDERKRKYVVIDPNDETHEYGLPVTEGRYVSMRAAEAAATRQMKKERRARFLMGYCLKNI